MADVKLCFLLILLFHGGWCFSNIQELQLAMDEYLAPTLTALQQRIQSLELHQHQTDEKMAAMERVIESLQRENTELRQRGSDNEEETNNLKLQVNEYLPQRDKSIQTENESTNEYQRNGTAIVPKIHKILKRHHNSYEKRVMTHDSTVPVTPSHDEKRRKKKPGVIAFSATYLGNNLIAAHVKNILKFDRLLTNHGGCYDKTLGVFTCVRDGTYVFTWTILATPHSHVETTIVLNGSQQVLNDAFSAQDSTSSNTVIFDLHQGDRVWIEINLVNPADGKIFAAYSSFSGFLLK